MMLSFVVNCGRHWLPVDKCRVSNCQVCQMLTDNPARVASCNGNGHQPHSVVMTNWVRVALPPPRQWCLLTTLHRQNVSVLQRTLAYIPQENYSGHDRNDPQGERSNRELTDTIIGTDKMGLIDEEKGQTEGRSIDRYYYRHTLPLSLDALPRVFTTQKGIRKRSRTHNVSKRKMKITTATLSHELL